MIPKHEEEKFKCPHCEVVASQKWFNAKNAFDISIQTIEKCFFEYRKTIAVYTEEPISKFIETVTPILKYFHYSFIPDAFSIATCVSCDKFSLWVNTKMVYPKNNFLPPPNTDLNEDIQSIYIEASLILEDSPKGAAALLRLALQKLLKQVGKDGKNINDDIRELVKG